MVNGAAAEPASSSAPELAAPAMATAQFQVNTTSTNDQTRPTVAFNAGGGFSVVWESDASAGPDVSGRSIQRERFAFDGTAIDPELQVNVFTLNDQTGARIAFAANGSFVVTWSSDQASPGPDASGQSVQAIRFASDAMPLTAQLQVNSSTANDQENAAVASTLGGGFVVVWESYLASAGPDSSGESIQGQRFLPNGARAGSEFQVNTTTTGNQQRPDLAMGDDGGFVAVWESEASAGDDSDLTSIQAQRFLADGSTAGSEFQVNDFTTGGQDQAAVAMAPDGTFVVAWSSEGSPSNTPLGGDLDGRSIQARRYFASGVPRSGQFQVNNATTGDQERPAVAMRDDGSFVIAWQTPDFDGTGIAARRFNSDGIALGVEFPVNELATGDQELPSLSTAPNGDFVVVWASFGSPGSDQSERSVQARLFAPNLFADGFESGSVSAWTSSVP